MVVTDVDNGDVLAVVGSRNFRQPGFNRAIEAKRPVGSLLKPFVYMLALASPSQWSLASWVDDSPVTVTLANGKRWSPDNSDGRSHGSVRLIDALAQSYNRATVRSEEHTSELQSLMRISYAVFSSKKKNNINTIIIR